MCINAFHFNLKKIAINFPIAFFEEGNVQNICVRNRLTYK